MARNHQYKITVRWSGNLGTGTSAYRAYSRDHEIRSPGKPPIPASSDPLFHGDASRYSPEELLVASLSTCRMLWYLHLCVVNKVVVFEYEDHAGGIMEEIADGGGRFIRVTLRPQITLAAQSDLEIAQLVHHDAHEKCFIANSVNFPVGSEPVIRNAGGRPRFEGQGSRYEGRVEKRFRHLLEPRPSNLGPAFSGPRTLAQYIRHPLPSGATRRCMTCPFGTTDRHVDSALAAE